MKEKYVYINLINVYRNNPVCLEVGTVFSNACLRSILAYCAYPFPVILRLAFFALNIASGLKYFTF